MKQLTKLTRIVLLIAMLLLSTQSLSAQEKPPFDIVQVPTMSVERETARPTPDETDFSQNMEYVLNRLIDIYETEGLQAAKAFGEQRQMVLKDELVQVVLEAQPGSLKQVQSEIVSAGGELQSTYSDYQQALIPLDALRSLSHSTAVQYVREPRRAIPDPGVQVTQGVTESLANTWHTNVTPRDGTGVKVAIVDGGFYTYTNLLGTDLPASVITQDYTGSWPGTSPHGTACAEIVYDMAPGATMYLVKIGTDIDLGNAVTWLISQGVDVISMSMSWRLDGPGDGTGSLADIVKQARSNGILFVTSAGNDREVNWHGTFNDSSGSHLWPHGNNVNCFGPGTDFSCFNVPAGYSINVGLHWDDWTSVNQDYDMELYWFDTSIPGWSWVAGSYNTQNGTAGQTPEETISYIAANTGAYGVAVWKTSATRDVCFRLRASNSLSHLDEWVTSRSMGYPNDSPHATTVAALDVTSPYPQESYSSEGPTFGPGGVCTGGATKPDISGYANVDTVAYGPGVFNGTSSATPHVAGAAALYIEAYAATIGMGASPTPTQTHTYLESVATETIADATPGKDSIYGAGRLTLGGLGPNAVRAQGFQAEGTIAVMGIVALCTGVAIAVTLWHRRKRA